MGPSQGTRTLSPISSFQQLKSLLSSSPAKATCMHFRTEIMLHRRTGPLPAADFSFGTGTDGSPSGVAAATDGADDNSNNGGDAAAQGHNDIAASLAGYTFPQGSSTSASSTMRPPSNEDIAPLATTGPLGNPFGCPTLWVYRECGV